MDGGLKKTFAYQQMKRLEKVLADNVGVKSVVVGNTTVTYDDLMDQYNFWKRKVARESGNRPRAAQINLGNF